ncbi:MAG: hypothetical protein ABIG84_05905 [archaeon]
MATTTELTEKYIREHASIKDCLRKGLINYSALSRLIAKEYELGNKMSNEAILVAARRFKDKIKHKPIEDKILSLFKNSNIEIKNNVVIFTLEKYVYPDSLIDIEKKIKKAKALFFSIEGAKTITLIVQKQSESLIDADFKKYIVSKEENLSLVTITSPGIERTPGAVYYISGLFFDNEINILEFMSCYDDTLIVIDSKDVDRAIRFLNF